MRSRQIGAHLTLLVLLAIVAGCSNEDPKLVLLQAREGYQVDLLNWAERTVEPQAPALPAEGDESAPDENLNADTEVPVEAPGREGLLSLRVTRAMTNIELPCLTVDVIFGGENAQEVGRDTLELDLSEMSAQGGTKELNLVVSLPGASIAQVAVDLHRVDIDDPELLLLCEAKAVPELSR